MKHAFVLPVIALLATPLAAADFSANSNAKSWNLAGEEKAQFDGKVVDAMCELTGDCPSNCGDGDRQMAVLRAEDDVLVMVLKNNQPAFTGAVVDLLPYCGQDVTVDGLIINDDGVPINNIYLVQQIKAGDADWVKASEFTKDWAAKNPDAAGKGPWFRRDPRIQARIAEDGYLGLGLKIDEEFKAYLFE